MSGHLHDLHPAPNSELVAEMEMQPDHYNVIAHLQCHTRPDPEQARHARATIVVAFGKDLSVDEVNTILFDTIAALHAYLEEKHTLRLDYRPGEGEGPTPPDTAMPPPPMHPATTQNCSCGPDPAAEQCNSRGETLPGGEDSNV